MPIDDPFVGRADELALLNAEMQRVRGGEPRLVWLTGEAGIGKTSLVRRFTGGLSGVRVLWAGGDENETDLPYGVINQLLSDLPASDPGSGLTALRPDADPLAVGADLLSELGALQTSGPVLVVIDDAQWADHRSAQALVFVARRLRSDQVMILLSSRSDAPDPRQLWERALAQSQLTRRLPLGGLTAEDLRRLSSSFDGVLLSPAASRRLHEHTGGHPLYARALLEELPAEALMEASNALPAPHSMSFLVLVRLAKLSPDAQDLVLAAAVLGTRGALAETVRLADVADPVAALDEAVRAGLLINGPPGHPRDVAFPHVLVRAAIYADLSPARRHALHRRAGEVLGGASSLNHRLAAAVGPDAELAGELDTLAQQELGQLNWSAAADHLLAAADLSETAEQKGRRLAAAVAAMIADGDVARAARHESSVRATLPSAPRSRVLGQIALLTGRLSAARRELSVARQLGTSDGAPTADQAPTTDQATVACYLGLLSMVEGDVEQAVELCLDALLAGPPPEVAALARFTLMLSLAAQGRQQDFLGLVDAATDAGFLPANLFERQALQGMLALWSGQERPAAANLSVVLRDAPSGLVLQGRLMFQTGLAEALYRIGDWDGAASQVELAISLAQDAGIQLGLGNTYGVASYVSAGRGLWELAESQLAIANSSAEMLPWWASRAYAAVARATVAQARGDYPAMHRALREFDDPAMRERVDGLGAPAWRALRIEALLGLGRLDAAVDHLRELHERTRQAPGWASLEAVRLEAWLAELREDAPAARQAYEHGLKLAAERPATLVQARLETGYGRFLLAHGERRPALDVLRGAHEKLQRLRATPFLAVCDALLQTAGLRPASRAAPLDFTHQELAVARLVAAGRTNSEVGRELFITSRTVAFHLSNIYAKAGIASRRELAGRFPDLLS
jgi:ATP/maltotriose-dependent transcriptional regulator MalT